MTTTHLTEAVGGYSEKMYANHQAQCLAGHKHIKLVFVIVIVVYETDALPQTATTPWDFFGSLEIPKKFKQQIC